MRVLVAQCGVVRLHRVDEALLDFVELASLLDDVADLHPLLFLQRDDDRALVGGMIREEVYPKCKPIDFGDLRDQVGMREIVGGDGVAPALKSGKMDLTNSF